jgi:hypothetical protein
MKGSGRDLISGAIPGIFLEQLIKTTKKSQP